MRFWRFGSGVLPARQHLDHALEKRLAPFEIAGHRIEFGAIGRDPCRVSGQQSLALLQHQPLLLRALLADDERARRGSESANGKHDESCCGQLNAGGDGERTDLVARANGQFAAWKHAARTSAPRGIGVVGQNGPVSRCGLVEGSITHWQDARRIPRVTFGAGC